jgi:hypothetical protein
VRCFFVCLFVVYKEAFLVIAIYQTCLALLQIMVDGKRRFHANLIPFSPVTWLQVLSIEVVEFQALLRSMGSLVTGQGVAWQKWKRVGLRGQDMTGKEEDVTDEWDHSDDPAIIVEHEASTTPKDTKGLVESPTENPV